MPNVSTQRTQAPQSVDNAHNRAAAPDPLENDIGEITPFGTRSPGLSEIAFAVRQPISCFRHAREQQSFEDWLDAVRMPGGLACADAGDVTPGEIASKLARCRRASFIRPSRAFAATSIQKHGPS